MHWPISVKLKNYRSIGEEPQGFDEILPVNLIIGRNNTGKSTLLDAIELALAGRDSRIEGHRGKDRDTALAAKVIPEIVYEATATEEAVLAGLKIQSRSTASKRYQSIRARWCVTLDEKAKGKPRGMPTPIVITYPNGNHESPGEQEKAIIGEIHARAFLGACSLRLAADRDLVPESESNTYDVDRNGRGAANLLFLCKSHARFAKFLLVERELLPALNKIFEPEAHFTDLTTHKQENGNFWEIHLLEEHKGHVPLSGSGSGLKTVLLVLVLVILLPRVKALDPAKTIYCFEELENNLHPALLRRLLLFLQARAKTTNATFVLTTHSNVAIDLFASDNDAQLLSVTHDGKQTRVERVRTFVQRHAVLADLDVRASDLLQSNGIVWVEGPSDRIYLNRWIELASNGELHEGTHYTCVFYGGKVRAHMEASDPDTAEAKAERLAILRVNRNAAMLMDSDFKDAAGTLDKTKQRLKEEFEGMKNLCWVTQGREIENYLPSEVVARVAGKLAPPAALGQFQDIADFLEQHEAGAGKRFEKAKVDFAARVAPLLKPEHLKVLDLEQQVSELVERIRGWNGRR